MFQALIYKATEDKRLDQRLGGRRVEAEVVGVDSDQITSAGEPIRCACVGRVPPNRRSGASKDNYPSGRSAAAN
jgi:hypothetical protein